MKVEALTTSNIVAHSISKTIDKEKGKSGPKPRRIDFEKTYLAEFKRRVRSGKAYTNLSSEWGTLSGWGRKQGRKGLGGTPYKITTIRKKIMLHFGWKKKAEVVAYIRKHKKQKMADAA